MKKIRNKWQCNHLNIYKINENINSDESLSQKNNITFINHYNFL